MSDAPRTFPKYASRAKSLIQSPDQLKALLAKSARKLAGAGSRRLHETRRELELLIDLVRCWSKGEYRDVSTGTVATIVAGILYFVVPTDLIPDFLPAIGLVDDVAVIGYVVNAVRSEIERFAAWRNAGSPDDAGPGAADEESSVAIVQDEPGDQVSCDGDLRQK